DAGRARSAGAVEVMGRRVVVLLLQAAGVHTGARSSSRHVVTLHAGGVARRARSPRGVRVVAVGAAHAARVHLALQERAVGEDLVLLLTVGPVEPFGEQR